MSAATAQASAAIKLSVRDLVAYFGQNAALHGISLDFPANQINAIICPSGCGKSTLVRCINRMHEATPGGRLQGEILLDRENILAPEVDPVQIRRRIDGVSEADPVSHQVNREDNCSPALRLMA